MYQYKADLNIEIKIGNFCNITFMQSQSKRYLNINI